MTSPAPSTPWCVSMDIAPHAMPRTLSPASRLASGLSFAGDVAGDQALAWQSCTAQAACRSQVDGRGAHGDLRARSHARSDRPVRRAVGGRRRPTARRSWGGCAAGTRWPPRRPAPGGRFGAPADPVGHHVRARPHRRPRAAARGPGGVDAGHAEPQRRRRRRHGWLDRDSVAREGRTRARRAPAGRPSRRPRPGWGTALRRRTGGGPPARSRRTTRRCSGGRASASWCPSVVVGAAVFLSSAVPVLPATWTPEICAEVPVPYWTTATIICWTSLAT